MSTSRGAARGRVVTPTRGSGSSGSSHGSVAVQESRDSGSVVPLGPVASSSGSNLSRQSPPSGECFVAFFFFRWFILGLFF